jgi:hypothetical protein
MFKLFAALSVLFFAFASCQSHKQVINENKNSNDVQLIEAFKTQWKAGAKEFGGGVNYKIKIVVLDSSFKSNAVCVNQNYLPTKESNSQGFIAPNKFSYKGDTLVISASWSEKQNYSACNLTDSNAAATLNYSLRGIEKEISIPSFIVKQAKPRP